jgi:hypothetical protein
MGRTGTTWDKDIDRDRCSYWFAFLIKMWFDVPLFGLGHPWRSCDDNKQGWFGESLSEPLWPEKLLVGHNLGQDLEPKAWQMLIGSLPRRAPWGRCFAKTAAMHRRTCPKRIPVRFHMFTGGSQISSVRDSNNVPLDTFLRSKPPSDMDTVKRYPLSQLPGLPSEWTRHDNEKAATLRLFWLKWSILIHRMIFWVWSFHQFYLNLFWYVNFSSYSFVC